MLPVWYDCNVRIVTLPPDQPYFRKSAYAVFGTSDCPAAARADSTSYLLFKPAYLSLVAIYGDALTLHRTRPTSTKWAGLARYL